MIPLQSKLENIELSYSQANQTLKSHQFSLGGNWDYEHGCFDRSLDEAKKVWLRLPFTVISGKMDGESDNVEAEIQMGTPYILKHLYNDGLDEDARFMTTGGLINQFQNPVDKDADIEPIWMNKGAELLKEVEVKFIQ